MMLMYSVVGTVKGFDIPYMVNRVERVLSRSHTRKFCLWQRFLKKTITKYGKESETYELFGRVHLDYLELYRKYTYHEMHSYALDAIGEYELGDRKVAYEGTLDQLYNNDFETFIAYNRQDVELLVRLDKQFYVIINEAHSRGLIVPDKKRDSEKPIQAAGAYVNKKGLHEWIGSIDLNSLYPSILRSCNMSTETIIGQIRHTITRPMIESFNYEIAKAWDGKFACSEYDLVMEKDKDRSAECGL